MPNVHCSVRTNVRAYIPFKKFHMIILSIILVLLSNAVNIRRDLSILFNRIAILILIYCILQDMVSRVLGIGYLAYRLSGSHLMLALPAGSNLHVKLA